MNVAHEHAEWLSLVEASGPFLSMLVLARAFPQGLDRRNPAKAAELREAYEEWSAHRGRDAGVHHAWIRQVLGKFLEYPPEFLAEGQAIPPGMEAAMSNFGETVRPDLALKAREPGQKPLLLVAHHPREQDLDKPLAGRRWIASPHTRMAELLHAADVPLGLVTNGEQWTLVYAPRGETTGFASWYADLWMQEPVTLRAFHSLLGLRRFLGVAEPETLASLYAASSKDQQEVTDQLGYQVRQAVEMLVQAFDRIDAESGRTLLAGVSEKALYDSALTVMMRLVFLFSADERGLLLLGDPLYDQNYAVSTLSEALRERADQHGEEILGHRHDAWCRLLATFRAVHAGVEHEAMRLPPYGGTLFDPDRYPFLEGRLAGSRWQDTPAVPLAINNRVVLHLLEALQVLRVKVPGGGPAEARRLSFRALDIEQIGHVYEGLLDHTAKRARETVLGLAGAKNSDVEVSLSRLEQLAGEDTVALVEFLRENTGRSEKALRRLVDEPPACDEHALLIACGQDTLLAQRVKPFAGLLRYDSFDKLVVIPADSVYVTAGSDRRSTGTHYTPRSLTEPIVQHTLEPLVYVGPAEGHPKEQWQLKSPREILALKVCDMAMGSGAFLVQTCRYLGERLVEAWVNAERANPGQFIATPDGELSGGDPGERLIPADAAERLAIARRYVADRCLYGVDINPMAVEMAKLSLWLITLQKERPFTFLDHAFKCGDSLLGVSTVKQIENFSLRPGDQQVTFATANLFRYVEEASVKRRELEELPSNDHTQIETKTRLHAEAEAATAKVKALADCLVAFELRGLDGEAYEEQRIVAADHAEVAMRKPVAEFQAYACEQLHRRQAFHWPAGFPEVFARGGFDAIVGNPPFMGGKKISGNYGNNYRNILVRVIANGERGNADLVSYFFLRVLQLAVSTGTYGLIATNTIAQGETSTVGLGQMMHLGSIIYRAISSAKWPGTANLEVSFIWGTLREWLARPILDGREVVGINSLLAEAAAGDKKPLPLLANQGAAFQGSNLRGIGFVLQPVEAMELIEMDSRNRDVVFPYLIGEDLNSSPTTSPSRWVINFFDWERERAEQFDAPFKIVESRVLPERRKIKHAGTREKGTRLFWRYDALGKELYDAISKNNKVLVVTQTSKYHGFVFVPTGFVYGHKLVVFSTENWSLFAQLSSSIHTKWILEYGGFLETRPVYSPVTCYQTYPFLAAAATLSLLGEQYHAFRQDVMMRRTEGLTKAYNRFHDPNEQAADIAQLRALHVEMDRTVATAYGWIDLDLGHGFHETKQGIRYTLSEPARRTVLDRLLSLNHQRYEEEVKAGLHDKGAKKSKAQRKKTKTVPGASPQPELLAPPQGDLF